MAWYFIVFILGVVVGAGVAFVIFQANRRAAEGQLKQTFASLAGEALDANSRRLMDVLEGSGKRFTEAAAAQLDGKKALIDQSLQAVNERLEGVRQYLQGLEAQRRQDFGQLAGSVASLSQTAGELHKMLASTQRRGAWGERMAEDVLRLAEGSVVELDKLAGDPVDVYVNDQLVARGEVLVLNDNFCVRINEIVTAAEERGDK